MGRIRTIKPEAFLDEELWDLGEETGLPVFQAFVGIWTQCDREGRFAWKPRRLKAAVLPYWDGDFSRVLDALTTRGFLVRYASQGREFGLVRTFSKHQVINNRESASEIPPPTDGALQDVALTRAPRVGDVCSTHEVHAQAEGKGREGKGEEPPFPPEGVDEGFDEFWEAYPKRVGKIQARRAWKRLKASEREQVMCDVPARKRDDPQWHRDDGQFVPNPATYLNQRRFEDDWSSAKANGTTGEITNWT